MTCAGLPCSLVVGSPEKSSHLVRVESRSDGSELSGFPLHPERNLLLPFCLFSDSGMLLIYLLARVL